MKKSILMALLILGLIAGLIAADKIVINMNRASAQANLLAIDTQVLQTNLKKHVKFLTELNPSRTSRQLDSLNKSAEYIQQTFKEMGLSTRLQSYQVSGNTYHNVIAMIGDSAKPRIVVGAHYDVCDEENLKPEKLFAGADDNASGVAGLLELARLLQNNKVRSSDYAFEFVAYSLEEPPFFRTEHMGSYVHASSLSKANVEVKLMISLEMIGFFTDEPGSQNYPINFPMKQIYGDKGNFIALIGNPTSYFDLNRVQKLFQKASPLQINKLSAPSQVQGIDWSDHLNYWKFGYPAAMLTDTSFLRNKNYHQITDTIDTLNFSKMAEVVAGTENVVANFK